MDVGEWMRVDVTYHVYSAVLLSVDFLDHRVPRCRGMVESNLDLGARLLLWKIRISPQIFRQFYVSG